MKFSRAHEAGSIEEGSSIVISKSIVFANRVDRAVVGSQIEPVGAPRSAQSKQIEPARAPGAARSSQSRPDRAGHEPRGPTSSQPGTACRSATRPAERAPPPARQAWSSNFVIDLDKFLCGHILLKVSGQTMNLGIGVGAAYKGPLKGRLKGPFKGRIRPSEGSDGRNAEL